MVEPEINYIYIIADHYYLEAPGGENIISAVNFEGATHCSGSDSLVGYSELFSTMNASFTLCSGSCQGIVAVEMTRRA